MLWPNDVKEELSLAFVHAVAARAGFSVEEVRKDRDSIDLHICARGALSANSTLDASMLAVQLKATAAGLDPSAESIAFDLKRKNYDDLRTVRVAVPRVLMVFLMPEDDQLWLESTEDALRLRHCAYWMSLKGLGEPKGEKSARVHIPRRNVVNATTLRELMTRVSCQEELQQ